VPPEPALAGLMATWQAILRVRHPEFSGLVVDVIGGTTSDAGRPARPSEPPVACDAGASDRTTLVRHAA
jgi:hypothetical protein